MDGDPVEVAHARVPVRPESLTTCHQGSDEATRLGDATASSSASGPERCCVAATCHPRRRVSSTSAARTCTPRGSPTTDTTSAAAAGEAPATAWPAPVPASLTRQSPSTYSRDVC